jgi:hypothetical protein
MGTNQSQSTGTELVRISQDVLAARVSGASLTSAICLVMGSLILAGAALGSWLAPSLFIRRGLLSGDWFWKTAIILGGVFLVLGLLFRRSRLLVFDRRDRMLTFKKAIKGIGRRIPLHDIKALEIVPGDSATYAGKIDLVLSWPEGLRLGVVKREAEDQLLRDASVLAEFIVTAVRDTRQINIHFQSAGSGKQVAVSRCFNALNWALLVRHQKLVELAQGVLAVQEMNWLRALRGLFMAVGVCVSALALALVGGELVGVNGVPPWLLRYDVAGLVVGPILIWAALRVLSSPSVIMDRTRNEIRGERLRVKGRAVKQLPLGSVAVVQVVSCKRLDNLPDIVNEINLVLSQPPGERLTLMAHYNEKQIRADAQRLAEFMNVPLLDHSIGGETVA